ncbi:hypothetical protein SAMN05443665_1011104 [Actinomadura meyerae]|uniref:Uncharacterized protein n=1 Tax=Actinomadura meyerae TaxID=240840 RepID=A0A239I4S1_9ACTN|nr:hypothetical protein [Actinomadura meyerae]SNS88073.1 hypothetical protein SAMN05443665_1011104 [Actinomadura meyerae]
MPKVNFLLSSKDVPTEAVGDQSPGLRRTRTELARRGSLSRSFDNSGSSGGISTAALDGVRGTEADLAWAGSD